MQVSSSAHNGSIWPSRGLSGSTVWIISMMVWVIFNTVVSSAKKFLLHPSGVLVDFVPGSDRAIGFIQYS
jgi:hypothetical protein